MTMSSRDAAYILAHRQPGGVVALAARMGVNVNTLQHKLNPNNSSHHLYLEEAEQITGLTGDAGIVHAMARACNHVCIPVGVFAGVSDVELIEQLAKLGSEFGDVMREVHASLSDRKVTRREIEAIERELYEMNAAGAALLARLRELLDERSEPALRVAK